MCQSTERLARRHFARRFSLNIKERGEVCERVCVCVCKLFEHKVAFENVCVPERGQRLSTFARNMRGELICADQMRTAVFRVCVFNFPEAARFNFSRCSAFTGTLM